MLNCEDLCSTFLCSMVSSPLNCEDRLIRVTGGKVGKECSCVAWYPAR